MTIVWQKQVSIATIVSSTLTTQVVNVKEFRDVPELNGVSLLVLLRMEHIKL